MNKRLISGKTYEQHVEAAKASGASLERYAREHDLSVSSLYTASKRLRAKTRAWLTKESTPPESKPNGATVTQAPSAFVPVEVTTSAVAMTARLPNGIELEFSGVDTSTWSSVVHLLSSLPCSR